MSDTPTDIVDAGHQDRNCPYCGRSQFWFQYEDDPHYVHLDDNLRYCDDERLALWDMSESLRAPEADRGL